MDRDSRGPVVVGVDGSAQALRAVRRGATEAVLRHRPLRVVHAFVWPLLHVDVGRPPGAPPSAGLRNQAERIVADAAAEARATVPGIQVDGRIVTGQAAAVLCRQAATAALLVLGDRGLGGFTGLLVGSVAVQVVAHADCPVLLERGTEHAGPVVVGVDGSALSQRALGFAVREAALRGTECRAVHAFRHPVANGPGDMVPLVYDTEMLRAQQDRVLAEAVAGWADRHPDVPVIRRVVHGRAAPVLIEESTAAQLVVVGARGRGGIAGLLLGSTSQALLHHAACPTAVVRAGHGSCRDG